MAEGMISVFGCEEDERRLFERCAALHGVGIRCTPSALSGAHARDIAPGSAVSVNHRARVDADLLHLLGMRGVRYVSSRSVGLDHIDRDAAMAAGIRVESVAYSPQSVAEYAVLLMLMALRNAGALLRRVDRCDFRLEAARARELRDMTVGVVGTGRIGAAVIDALSGFGCPIRAHDPHPTLPVPYMALDELLASCDIVTLHLPLTGATRHLIDAARIARMRRGSILVNTARGALVDARALADALEGGHIACAALDVVEGEDGWFYRDCSDRPPPPFARLLALPNAIITPHTAFYTEHALRDIVENTVRGYLHHEGGTHRWAV